MTTVQETSIPRQDVSEMTATKDKVRDEQATQDILKLDISLDDIDWTEPFELEEDISEIQSLLQDAASIDWSDESFPEMNTSTETSTILRDDHSTEFKEHKTFSSEIIDILQVKFGLRNFRDGQREIINAILNGNDCFVLMPTGGGKSLCYQLPALLSKGVTIVISPLIALISDQVDKLKALDIRAAHLCSTLANWEIKEVFSKLYLSEPEIDILYVTPEKILSNSETRKAIDSLYSRKKLARFILDEVHCLSLWGHDFRPHYKQLGVLREKYEDIQIVCFTATATKQVENDIIVNLKLRDVKRFIQSFNRPNIKYQVIDKSQETAYNEIGTLIRIKFLGKFGIVYCLTRKDCMKLSRYLQVMGIAAKPYHAGLDNTIRERTQREWMRNEFHVIVATIAFGMGIDKPDVRFVIHNTIPKSLEAFYQESGRAGRDGEVSYSYLFYNYDDVLRIMKLMGQDFAVKNTLDGHFDNLEQMVAFANNQLDCRRYLQLLNLGEIFDRRLCMENEATVCDNCENFEHHVQSEIDVTKQGKELAILVRDVTRRFDITLNDAVKIYKGSRERCITKKGFQSHKYFGKGRLLTRLDIYRILRVLISRNILIYHYLTTGAFPLQYVKPGPEFQTFVTSSDVIMTIPVERRRALKDVCNQDKYPTLSGFMTKNLSLTRDQYLVNSIKSWCHEALLDLCFKYAVERGKSVRSVLHPVAVRYILEKLPRNREELLEIENVTVGIYNEIGGDILTITNHFRNKMQVIQYEIVAEPQEVSDADSIDTLSDYLKRTHSEAFPSNDNKQ